MRIIPLQQGSAEWKRWRLDGIGGSDVACLTVGSPFDDATRENLLEEKVTGKERETNFAMRRGTALESQARFIWEQENGIAAPPCCVQHDDVDWMRVSLDGLTADHSTILEIKAPNWMVHDYALNGLVPDYYAVQCQYQMLVTGVDRCVFLSFNNGKRFAEDQWNAAVELRPDAELQAWILDAAEAFWAERCRAIEAKEQRYQRAIRNAVQEEFA